MQTMARMFTCLHSVCILCTGSLKIKLFYLDKSSLYLGLATYTLWSNIKEEEDAVVQVSRTKIGASTESDICCEPFLVILS